MVVVDDSQICLEKVSWIPTHSNWKRILVKTERQGICYLCKELSDAWQCDLAYESWAWIEDKCTEMSMIRRMCGVKLNERKKSEELRELLELEPVSLMIKKSRLRWFGHVEQKDDNDWVKRCIMWEVEVIRQRTPEKIWWDCVENDMKSFKVCLNRMRSSGINGEGELRGNWLTQVYLKNGR